MNRTLLRLSTQALFGRRRGVVLLLIAGALLALAVLIPVLTVGAVVGGRSGAATSVSAPATGSAPSPSGVAAQPTEPNLLANEDDLASARKAGVPALAELLAKHPKDARILIAAAKLEIAAKKHADAVATLGKALVIDPSINESPELASALWTTAQAKDSTAASFELLEGPMGARGADMIHDLATDKRVRREVRERADTWLGSGQFQRQSDPKLNVLVALERATTCKQRYALLARAKSQGDERALALLQSYQKQSGCGKKGTDDCNPCMRSDDRLAEATAAIRERTKK